MSLSRRNLQAELMDDPELDARIHRHALEGLGRINTISGTARVLWSHVATFCQGRQHTKILDLASGGGDLAIALAQRARAAGVKCTVHGWDISSTAVSYAQAAAAAQQVDEVEFSARDVLYDEITESFDVILCTLFLHHLPEDDAVRLLRRMRTATGGLVLVDDLRRSWLGYWMAWFGCRLLTRSSIVHIDGPRSVAGAYSAAEIRRLARAAGMENYRLQRHWPQRFLLSWRKP